MPVGTLLLALLVFAMLIVGAIAIAPVLTSLVGSGRLRRELATKRAEARIATKALREIRTNDGNGAYLIADIALNEIESNELRELN